MDLSSAEKRREWAFSPDSLFHEESKQGRPARILTDAMSTIFMYRLTDIGVGFNEERAKFLDFFHLCGGTVLSDYDDIWEAFQVWRIGRD